MNRAAQRLLWAGLSVGLFVGILQLETYLKNYVTTRVVQTHGMKIEVRRCHPVDDEDDSQTEVTCACTVSDWIEDGDKRVLVCEK